MLGTILRVGVFVFLALLGYIIFPAIMELVAGSLVVASALGFFAAAAVANAIALRIYERGKLSDIGLGWTAASARNLALGVAGGAGAALIVILGPILVRVADIEPAANAHVQWGSVILLSIVLVFGAVGEEMLFRGYGFQVLVRAMGPFATILPFGVLFGLAHSPNLNFSALAFVNTTLWGILLGYSFIRSGDLWLPIGLHFGWNWIFPLFGVNLSGFTILVTGFSVHWKVGALWSGGPYGPEGGLLTTAIVVALFFYLQKAPVQQQPAFLLQDPEQTV